MLVDLEVEVNYLGHLINFYTIQYNTIQLSRTKIRPDDISKNSILRRPIWLDISISKRYFDIFDVSKHR